MVVASNIEASYHRSSVVVICMVACTGGLIFGYDLGNTVGGVTSMEPFIEKFFPPAKGLESQLLTLFTSSLYLAALVASFFASAVTTSFGRRISMLVGGLAFSLGSLFSASAVNVAMLVVGRLLLGIGVGFANQSVPLYVSEMAPPMIRGTLSICFQIAIMTGVILAYLVNYCVTC